MDCAGLTSVYLPKANGDSNYEKAVFQNCTSLEYLVLPSYTALPYSDFARGCTALIGVDMPFTFINWASGIFRDDTNFNLLILRHTAVVTLNGTSHFIGTPFENGGTGGDIYVPSDLLSSYQQASNWSSLAATWHAIEGSYYETHYADGTVIE